jgi:AraC-like DNA-binding protein
LTFRDDAPAFHAQHATLECDGLAVDWITFGSAVHVSPEEPLGHVHCSLAAVEGAVEVSSEGSSCEVAGTNSVILDDERRFELDGVADTLSVLLRVESHLVHRHALDLLGEATPRTTFELAGPPAARGRARWELAVRYVTHSLANQPPPDDQLLWLDELHRFTVLNMLLTHPNSAIQGPVSSATAGNAAARSAAEYLRVHLAEPIRIADVAALFGVSTRALQLAFRRTYDMSPRDYLRDLRLQRAHLDLVSDEAVPIATVAHRWGFSSPSRFARAYAAQFGELPSLTRRQGYVNGRTARPT